jgi:3-isopropylmalate dehydratase small subunit
MMPASRWRTSGVAHVFGDDIVHDNGMMAWKHIIERQTDPDILVPCLFEAIDPDFARRVKPGDFIIAGKRFGAGKPHTTAYVAMAALGLRVLCESSFDKVMRGAANLGVPIMANCLEVSSEIRDGESICVDMATGEVVREDRATLRYPPLQRVFQQTIELGGRAGILKAWLATHPEMASAYD